MQKVAFYVGLILTPLISTAVLTPAFSQGRSRSALVTATPLPAKKVHRVVIQVSQNDPAMMRMALNNGENLVSYYREKGDEVELEFVAYGPGLHLVRSDTSQVKERLKALAEGMKQVTFSGCENTRSAQSKQEKVEVTLVSEARPVPSGIARITELQEQGWAYVRP